MSFSLGLGEQQMFVYYTFVRAVPRSMWKEFAKFLDGEHTFAGGIVGKIVLKVFSL